jgi:predicted nucleic acid-binding protein
VSVTLVDTNVLLDVITDDPAWAEWSVGQLDAASLQGTLAINDVVYAELSVRMATIEALDTLLAEAAIGVAAMPRPAVFLAGRAFQRYRAAGGTRTGVLPAFFIGAHAAVMGWALLTRDAGRYRAYFPKLGLIAPT